MKSYLSMTVEERKAEYEKQVALYEQEKKNGYKLDMSRGKPNPAQLDLCMDMLSIPAEELVHTANGTDTRNYGGPTGIDEAKALFAELLQVKPQNIIVGGQASLNLMYDCFIKAVALGVAGGSKPWGAQGKIKFLCPAPGYDRHFRVSQSLGAELIPIAMTPAGPDMDQVRRYAESDPQVKGIWCVPKYSNPQGITYSDDTVRALAALKPAADDFRIFWDNAYFLHGFREQDDPLMNIFDACREYGSEDMVYEFMSFSKISFAGASISCIAASDRNIALLTRQIGAQTICYDKINQLRHVKYFRNAEGVRQHMKKHAAQLCPKFDGTLNALETGLGGLDIGTWTHPNGGYFISYDGLPGTAKRSFQLCADCGVKLTGAGAAFPYGIDPEDKNIRIAPSYPSVEELLNSIRVFCISQRMAALEILMK